MALMADIGPGAVAADAVLFIYFIEEDSRFLPIIEPLFREADGGKRRLVTSVLTLLEVLVVPYRAGNRVLAERYEALLTRSRGIRLVEATRDHFRAAAQLRAATGVKTPDALQLVAAISAGCKAFVTNDRRLPDIPGIQILQLRSYLSTGA